MFPINKAYRHIKKVGSLFIELKKSQNFLVSVLGVIPKFIRLEYRCLIRIRNQFSSIYLTLFNHCTT